MNGYIKTYSHKTESLDSFGTELIEQSNAFLGMAEADFIRGYLWIHDAVTGKKLVDEKYARETKLSQHYGADEQMAADVLAHVKDGVPLPVSVIDAMEAGLLIMAIDEARKTKKVVEMEPLWKKFDECLKPKDVN